MNDNKSKEIDITNSVCYYFDDIININDFDLDNILIDEKSYENILICDVVCKVSYGAKPLRIVFGKADGYIRKYDKTRYLAFFHSDEKCERIFDRIRYFIMLKSNISDIYCHKYTKFEIKSNDVLSLDKAITMHDVIILVKFFFNENHSRYY